MKQAAFANAPMLRAIAPDDAPGLTRLWREAWTSIYAQSLGEAALAEMLRDLDGGVASMLPGTGERGYCLIDGDDIDSSVWALAFYSRHGFRRTGEIVAGSIMGVAMRTSVLATPISAFRAAMRS